MNPARHRCVDALFHPQRQSRAVALSMLACLLQKGHKSSLKDFQLKPYQAVMAVHLSVPYSPAGSSMSSECVFALGGQSSPFCVASTDNRGSA